MLKSLGYGGTYHDQKISLGVLLENPSDYNFEATTLVFSVTLRNRQESAANLDLQDFSFYIMDEHNQLYNAQNIPGHRSSAFIPEDDEPVRSPDRLIFTEFRLEFLFQDLRIAFYHEPSQQFHIIQLQR